MASCAVFRGESTAPVVQSVVLASASPSGLPAVQFTVTFSKQMGALLPSHFDLSAGGAGSSPALVGAAVTGIVADPSGKIFTVTVGNYSHPAGVGADTVTLGLRVRTTPGQRPTDFYGLATAGASPAATITLGNFRCLSLLPLVC